jgi:hypothetical protein
MSGISPIRRFTETDTARIEASAVRFAARHKIALTAPSFVEYEQGVETLDETGELVKIGVEKVRFWHAPTAADEVQTYLDGDDHGRTRTRTRLARLWQACFCRALGFRPCADLTIAFGYVGKICR